MLARVQYLALHAVPEPPGIIPEYVGHTTECVLKYKNKSIDYAQQNLFITFLLNICGSNITVVQAPSTILYDIAKLEFYPLKQQISLSLATSILLLPPKI